MGFLGKHPCMVFMVFDLRALLAQKTRPVGIYQIYGCLIMGLLSAKNTAVSIYQIRMFSKSFVGSNYLHDS